jgi:hypothetical protein
MARWSTLSRVELVAPTVAYGLATLLSHLAGFRMRMGWGSYQLLDRQALAEQPAQALWLLHSQPPGLNALLAASLRFSAASGVSVELSTRILFLFAGWLSAWLLFRILREVSDSSLVAVLGVVILVSNPGFHYFANRFFYPFPLQTLFLLWAWLTLRYLRDGRSGSLAGLTFTLAAISLTRVLYPPAWAAVTFGTVLLGRARVAGRLRWKQSIVFGLVLVALLAVWPSKNRALFGQYSSSSWAGYNLTLRIPVKSPQRSTLNRYIRTGQYPASVDRRFDEILPGASELQRRLLLGAEKSDGSRNWNHLLFVETNRALVGMGLHWRRMHPARWLSRAVAYYAMWSRPTFVHPYEGYIRGPAHSPYRGYAGIWGALFFADLRPIIEGVTPSFEFHEQARVLSGRVPYTVFGLIFPLCLAAVALTVLRRRRSADTGAAIAGILLLVLLWSAALPCLTDGVEGNRMRFATSPFLLVLIAYLVRAWRTRGSPPRDPCDPPIPEGDPGQ